jgi:hypothetical protein
MVGPVNLDGLMQQFEQRLVASADDRRFRFRNPSNSSPTATTRSNSFADGIG